MRFSASGAAILSIVLGSAVSLAADFSSYRGFRFGGSVEAAAKQAGSNSTSRVVHQRPALIEELDWRPDTRYRREEKNDDPIDGALLRFYNGELFQIVTTYRYQKVEGMTDRDMVDVISQTYGAATKPDVEIPYRTNYGDKARVIARWENEEYTYNLVRTGDRMSFALLLSSKRLESLARAAIAESVRLDLLEAPQKAKDSQKKSEDESRESLEKARAANKPNFRP